jgi:hypothetical protein
LIMGDELCGPLEHQVELLRRYAILLELEEKAILADEDEKLAHYTAEERDFRFRLGESGKMLRALEERMADAAENPALAGLLSERDKLVSGNKARQGRNRLLLKEKMRITREKLKELNARTSSPGNRMFPGDPKFIDMDL